MSDLDSLDDSIAESLTSEQQTKLNQVVEICSDETVDNCRKTLERNDWEVDRSIMELLSPVDQNPIPSEPDIVRASENRPTIPTQTSAPNLRRRNIPSTRQQVPRRTFAQVASHQRQPRAPGRLRTLITKIINTAMKILQYVFNVPGYIISSVPGLSWLQAATNTRAIISAGLTRKEQVKKSIDLIKSSCSKLEGVDFIEGSYSDALTRSKKEVRYLVCYVHLDEHEDTKIFLDKIGDDLNEFLRQNNALFWGCSFDCPGE